MAMPHGQTYLVLTTRCFIDMILPIINRILLLGQTHFHKCNFGTLLVTRRTCSPHEHPKQPLQCLASALLLLDISTGIHDIPQRQGRSRARSAFAGKSASSYVSKVGRNENACFHCPFGAATVSGMLTRLVVPITFFEEVGPPFSKPRGLAIVRTGRICHHGFCFHGSSVPVGFQSLRQPGNM